MALAPGQRLGAYEIIGLIGAGGMGEVYRARDTRLQRTVAIKTLTAAAAADSEFRQRFEREARTISNVEHPHICSLYDVGHENGIDFLVMQMLDGETLATRLQRGPLAAATAIRYGIEIASALDKAHRHGVVHRDLKPGNIMLTKTGAVLLDFGLAKSPVPDRAVPDEMTRVDPVTGRGAILGTPHYMSPEQVRGQELDHRSDIFAFGVVLYEMLSGKRAFSADSQVETLHAILKADPVALDMLQASIPAPLARIVARCLQKDPADRFQSATDLAFALEAVSGVASTKGGAVAEQSPPARNRRALGVAALLLVAIATAIAAFLWTSRPVEETRVARFAVTLPDNVNFYREVETHNLSVAPDGRHIAFVAISEGQRSLWIRQTDSLAPKALPGTDGAYSPFWSPDGRYLAFFADGKLKRIDANGGSVQTICALPNPVDASGSWGLENVIVFVEQFGETSRLYQVAASGGTPALVEEPTPSTYRSWVHFLPDGRHYLLHFANVQDPAQDGVYVRSVAPGARSLVLPTPMTRVEYAQGHLVYAREGSLLAQRFDASRFALSGEPFTLVSSLPFFDKTGWAEFSVSTDGLLVYLTALPTTRIAWLDRSGRELSSVTEPGPYQHARLSPDGQKIALRLNDPRALSGDLWVHEVARGTASRFAFGAADDSEPVWSPDGRRLAYFSCCEAKSTIFIKALDEAGRGMEPLGPGFQVPFDWSADGQFLLYVSGQPTTERDVWVLPVKDSKKPFPLIQTPFNEVEPRFSPDGQWVAYVSNEAGRSDVYAMRFGGSKEKVRISVAGGSSPRWRADGRELFFLAADRLMMSAGITAIDGGQRLDFSTPTALFRSDDIVERAFDVSADGQRFLVVTRAGQREPAFTAVLNWTAEAR